MNGGVAKTTAEERELYRKLWRAKAEGDAAFLIDWLRRFPDEPTLAARWLADMNAIEALPELTRLLGSTRPPSRIAALHAMGRLGPPPAARVTVEAMATGDPDPGVRSWALSTLGQYRDPQLLPLLSGALGDRDWRVRNGAAVGLGELGDVRAIAPLENLLRRLRRRPKDWYLGRSACKKAIEALQRESRRGASTG